MRTRSTLPAMTDDPQRHIVPVVAHQPDPPTLPPPLPSQPRPASAGPSGGVIFLITGGITLALLIVGSLGYAMWNARNSGSSGSNQPQVEITNCTNSGSENLRTARISYRVTNRDNRTRTVIIEFSVSDGGTRLGTATAVEPDLPPGRTAEGDAVLVLPRGRTGTRCGVDRVR